MPAAQDVVRESGRYRAILMSTSLIGGASAVSILVGMVRTKALAVILGPAGVGLLALYSQVIAVVSTLSGLGVAESGVREVARAVGTGDEERVGRTVTMLRRVAWLTGCTGMLVMVAFAGPISQLTFGDRRQAWAIASLGATVLMGALAAAQSSLLRGTRRIADVARVTILGAVIGVLVSVPCYLAWGLRGVVVALLVSSAAGLAATWHFARAVVVPRVNSDWRESRREARQLLSLGVSFMAASVLSTGTTYAVQVLVTHRFGLSGAGMYQAAFSLSGTLVGFVLGAMSADYYPRLTAIASDDSSVRGAVNEQAQVSILLALPGLAAMTVFAPIVIELFYAENFSAAVPILRWCILGVLGRILSWPLGFVLLARGNARVFLATEAAGCAAHLGAVALFIRLWGLGGAGIAFAALYVAYTALMLVVIGRTIGGSWTRSTLKLNALAIVAIAGMLLNASFNPEPISRWGLGLVATASISWFCVANLMHRSNLTLAALTERLRWRP